MTFKPERVNGAPRGAAVCRRASVPSVCAISRNTPRSAARLRNARLSMLPLCLTEYILCDAYVQTGRQLLRRANAHRPFCCYRWYAQQLSARSDGARPMESAIPIDLSVTRAVPNEAVHRGQPLNKISIDGRSLGNTQILCVES